jgi:hypothetical protein
MIFIGPKNYLSTPLPPRNIAADELKKDQIS